jgi:glycosyltransferase involved in cell wall biosynthesis
MKTILCFFVIASLVGCDDRQKTNPYDTSQQDEKIIRKEIADFHAGLKKAYNNGSINTDSLMDAYFDGKMYYVTYWGNSEPMDSTKKRLRNALPAVKEYDNQFENLKVKVYGDGAYAFFILRQDYKVNGHLLEEYLPTTFVFERRGDRWIVVHAQRTADYQTFQQLAELSRVK